MSEKAFHESKLFTADIVTTALNTELGDLRQDATFRVLERMKAECTEAEEWQDKLTYVVYGLGAVIAAFSDDQRTRASTAEAYRRNIEFGPGGGL